MSSGLVASMGMPASAVGRNATSPEAAPVTAPIAVQPALAFQSSLIASQAKISSAAPLTAPVAATISFENSSSFRAVPKVIRTQTGLSQDGRATTNYTRGYGSAKGSSVLAVASRYIGVNYRYGGTSPIGWDCSGAMGYIFNQIGVKLPRTANQQMLASKRISRSEARPGDLVFMVSGGSAYHVGIFAGGNQFYDAGRQGKSFSKRDIWTSNVVFGRVL
jgi:cell wall-associated NlpC family hydrolase